MHKDISGPPLSVRERMATRLHRFRRDDAGTITVLAMHDRLYMYNVADYSTMS